MLIGKVSLTYSQNATDSIKIHVETARKIALDLARLDYLDSTVIRKDSIISNNEEEIELHLDKIDLQASVINDQGTQIVKLKKKSKLFIIFGAVIGLMTQLIF